MLSACFLAGTSANGLHVHIHQKEKIALKIAVKVTSVNEPSREDFNAYPLIALINADLPAPVFPVMAKHIFTNFDPSSFFLRNPSIPVTPFFLMYALASAMYCSVGSPDVSKNLRVVHKFIK